MHGLESARQCSVIRLCDMCVYILYIHMYLCVSVGGVRWDGRSKSDVGSLVLYHVARPRHPHAAGRALVRLFPGMDPLVNCHVPLLRRPNGAVAALKRLFPGVDPQVPCVITTLLG